MYRTLLGAFLLLGLAPGLRAAAPPPRPLAPKDGSLPDKAVLRIGSPYWRHGGPVTALAFSPDGKLLASGSRDSTVSLWEVPSGKERARLTGHDGPVRAVAFARDGGRLASGSPDGSVRVWGLKGRWPDLIHSFDFGSAGVEGVAFMPGGKVVLAVLDDSSVRVLDVDRRIQKQKIALPGPSLCLALAPNGKSLAVGGERSTLALLALDTGKLVRTLGSSPAQAVAFSADGKLVAAWEDPNVVRVWEADTGRERFPLRAPDRLVAGRSLPVTQIAFSRDGKLLAAGSSHGLITLWDAATGKAKEQLEGGLEAVVAVAFSPDGSLLASAGGDNAITLWDVATGKRRTSSEVAGPILSQSVSADGKILARVDGAGRLHLHHLSTGAVQVVPRELKGPFRSVVYRPGTKEVGAVPLERSEWQRRDAGTGRVLALSEGPRVTGQAFSADGKLLATWSGTGDGTVALRDPQTGKTKLVCRTGSDRLRGVALAPDGSVVAGFGPMADVLLWKAKTAELLPSLPQHRGGVQAVAFSADSRLLAAAGRDTPVRLWEVSGAGGGVRVELEAASRNSQAVAFAPDCALVATGSADGAVLVWQADTGKLLRALRGHRGAVTGLTFLAKGKRLVSTGADTTAWVWDIAGVKPHPVEGGKLDPVQAEALWEQLAGSPAEAGAALRQFAAGGDEAVRLIRMNLQPIDGKKVASLIEKLDADEYAVREQSARELVRYGQAVAPALQEALARKPALEKHRRLEDILRQVNSGASSEYLRSLRAVEVLERVGSALARKELERLASGLPSAGLTEQARSALERLRAR